MGKSEETRMAAGTKRVLVVDDDPVLGTLLGRMLGGLGLDVRITTSPTEAVGLARRSPPDLVLADVCMPGLDGPALCALLRGFPETSALPVILCTGRLAEDLQGAGAAGYLGKPFTRDDLHHAVRSVLDRGPECAAAAMGRSGGLLGG